MNTRFIKLPANLSGSFCPLNPQKDFECEIIYMRLLVEAAWCDGPVLKRGQCLQKWDSLALKLPGFHVQMIRRRVAILIRLGYVKTALRTKWVGDGNILTLCHYDNNSNENTPERHEKPSKNRQNIDRKPTEHLTTKLTENNDFNELNLQDLSENENKTDRTFDNKIDRKKNESRQATKYIECRIKKIKEVHIAISAPETDAFMTEWNSTVKGSIPKIIKLTPTRQKKIKSFLKEFSFDDWKKIIVCINASPWHNGTSNEWVADFDWAFTDKALKLIEKSISTKPDKYKGMKVL